VVIGCKPYLRKCFKDNMAFTLSSLFTKKKPEYDPKSPIQTTMAGAGQALSYSPPMLAANFATNAAGAGLNSAKNFLTRFDQPQTGGMSKAPQMSVAPKQQIQGSGMSDRYASNPSNYKPSVTTPSIPSVTPKTTPSVPSYITGYETLAERKKKLLEQQKTQGTEFLTKQAAEKNRLLAEAIPDLQKRFAATSSNIDRGIASAAESAKMKEAERGEQWGESQRLAAQTRGESEARNRNRFAALGTIGSYGAGSYGQAQENVESEFNRFTQQGLRQKERDIYEIQKALQDYELEAEAKKTDLGIELDGLVRQIASDMRMTDIEKENAIGELVNQYQSAVLGVEEGLQGIYSQYYDKLASAEGGLSNEFMTTGVPQNETDYRYYIENKDQIDKMLGGGVDTGKQQITNVIDQLLTGDLATISGIGGFRKPAFGESAAMTSNTAKQLIGLLSLENRQKLKGQGAITDREMAMLDRAASRLGIDPETGTSNLSEQQIRQELEQLRSEMSGQPSLSSILG
jgi:hypothetical protein